MLIHTVLAVAILIIFIFKELNPNLPMDPFVQLEMAIKAVFQSWYNPRAVRYRAYNGISANSGTAVNVQSMVFGK